MRARRAILGTILVLVGAPVAAMVAFIGSTSALDRTNDSLISNGVERHFLLYVPPTYDSTKPTPLVISLHGAGAWPAQQMHLTHWNDLADEQGFIVVYPEAVGRIWRVAHPGMDPSRDVRFIGDLIDTLERRYHVDPARIYANGFSLGGGMTFALSCRLSERLAAVATVSAVQALPAEWCGDGHPMPLVSFHGTADLVPYDGGRSPDPFNRVILPPVRGWTAAWARRNGCAMTPVDSSATNDVTATAYDHCPDSRDVLLYTVRGGGHAWPGGKALPSWIFGRTATSIQATRLMWAFFQAHPRRSPE